MQAIFLTEKEASERYRLSIHWFRRARWAGGGPPYVKNQGGRVLYPIVSTDEFFQSRLRTSTSAAA